MHYFLLCLLLVLFQTSLSPACTIFYAVSGDTVLAGRNLDWVNPNAYVYFAPGENGKFGWIYFGFDSKEPQGGVNEKGLFIGNTTTEPEEVILSDSKDEFDGNLVKKVMTECSSVDEAIDVFESYDLPILLRNQLFISDGYGNSAVIEGNTISRINKSHQILTNFRYSKWIKDPDYEPCDRYNIVKDMLGNQPGISIDLFRKILAATSQEGSAATIYSYIVDFGDLVVYLYHFHNFENVVKLDVAEELKKEKRCVEIASMFPRTYAAEGFERWKQWDLRKRREEKTVVNVNPELYAAYCGEYRAKEIIPGRRIHITAEGNALYFQVPDHSRLELLPESNETYFYMSLDGDFEVIFVSDESGEIVQLLYKEGDIEIPFEKVGR